MQDSNTVDSSTYENKIVFFSLLYMKEGNVYKLFLFYNSVTTKNHGFIP